MEESVMKFEGGTRQEGGQQDSTPTSSSCVGPSLSDIHSLWTDEFHEVFSVFLCVQYCPILFCFKERFCFDILLFCNI